MTKEGGEMKVKKVEAGGSWYIQKLHGDKRIIAVCTRHYDACAIVRVLNKMEEK